MTDEIPHGWVGAAPAARLVLASSSVYRRALLARLCVPFAWLRPGVDETRYPGESPAELVTRLARAKAHAVAGHYPRHLVIGSDQVATIDGRVLGKPGGHSQAVAQLEASIGRIVQFLTSVCVLDTASGDEHCEVVPCDVHFRALGPAQIEAYVAAEQPFDCAGSFKSEGLGIALFERLVGDDPSALTGLPLIALTRLLGRCGFDIFAHLSAQGAAGELGQDTRARTLDQAFD